MITKEGPLQKLTAFAVSCYVKHKYNKPDKQTQCYIENKTLYKIWLYFFDLWSMRLKRGKKRSRCYIFAMNLVWPHFYNRTTYEERVKLYQELNS